MSDDLVLANVRVAFMNGYLRCLARHADALSYEDRLKEAAAAIDKYFTDLEELKREREQQRSQHHER